MGLVLYFKAGPWTPESAVEDPEAVRQLHREFLRAGSDVMQVGFMQFAPMYSYFKTHAAQYFEYDFDQAFTFYASEDKLTNRGNKAGKTIGVEAINRAASKLAKEVEIGPGKAHLINKPYICRLQMKEEPSPWEDCHSVQPTCQACPRLMCRRSSRSRLMCLSRRAWTSCFVR